MARHDGRRADQLRAVSIEPNYLDHAEGSAMVRFGNTWVLCTVSMEDRVPQFLRGTGGGWVTAEYGMLPRSTNTRTEREAARGTAERALAGDPAADRPGAAQRHEPRPAGRAQLSRRLRRDPRRRRHAHGVDHRLVRGAGAGAAAAREGRRRGVAADDAGSSAR